jgi:hypothetical protein
MTADNNLLIDDTQQRMYVLPSDDLVIQTFHIYGNTSITVVDGRLLMGNQLRL